MIESTAMREYREGSIKLETVGVSDSYWEELKTGTFVRTVS